MKKIIFPGLISVFTLAAFVFTSGCTQECEVTTVRDTITKFDTVTNTVWTLQYFEGTSGNNMFYAPPTFIKNGKAYFPSNLFHQNYWFAEYTLPIPKEINLNLDTDSLKIVANVRNVSGDGNSNEIDLGINSDIQFYATFQKQAGFLYYCQLNIGTTKITNINEHLLDPTAYGEYALQIQNNTISTFKNSTLLKSVSHTASRGGRVKYLNIAFRGYGEIDWVKLYKGSKLIMTEDFSTDGNTTALWVKP
jgi:hypothetical protein